MVKRVFGQSLGARENAIKVLRKLDPEVVVPKLARVLNRKNAPSAHRRWAAEALLKIDNNTAISRLSYHLNDSNILVRQIAIEALGRADLHRAIELLINAADDDEISVRLATVESLGKIGDASAVQKLLTLLEDGEPSVRCATVESLGRIGDASAIPKLLTLLEDGELSVRCATIESLGRIGDISAAFQLSNFLEDNESSIRRAAVESLGEIGDANAISKMLSLLDDEDPQIRQSTTKALGKIGGKSAVRALNKAITDENLFVRQDAVRALASIDDVDTVPGLLRAIQDEDKDVRLTAEDALGSVGEKIISEILNIFDESTLDTCTNLISLLGRFQSRTAIPKLTKLLKGSNDDLGNAAANALAQIGSNDSIIALYQTLNNENPRIAGRAKEVLKLVGGDIVVLLLASIQDTFQNGRSKSDSSSKTKNVHRAVASLLSLIEDTDFYNPYIFPAELMEQLKNRAERHLETSTRKLRLLLFDCYKKKPNLFLHSTIIRTQKEFYNFAVWEDLVFDGLSFYFTFMPEDTYIYEKIAKTLSRFVKTRSVDDKIKGRPLLPGDKPGEKYDGFIDPDMLDADVVLLLISNTMLNQYRFLIEFAVEQHWAHECLVIPILLHPIDCAGTTFSHLPVLHKKQKPFTTNDNSYSAFQEIAADIREVALELKQPSFPSLTSA